LNCASNGVNMKKKKVTNQKCEYGIITKKKKPVNYNCLYCDICNVCSDAQSNIFNKKNETKDEKK